MRKALSYKVVAFMSICNFLKNNSGFIKANFSLAWPLALNALLMQSMLIIDTLLVSPLGELPLAGMAIATTLIAFIIGVQFAFANGTQLVVGRAFGADNQTELSLAFFSGLAINISIGFLCLALLLCFDNSIIALITDDPVLTEQVLQYLSVGQYIILISAITHVITAFFNGQGKTKITFSGYLLEVPFNALISYLLIFGWYVPEPDFFSGFSLGFLNVNVEGLGVYGAALGSFMAVCLRLIYLIWQLNRRQIIAIPSMKWYQCYHGCKAHFQEISPIAANFVVLSVGHTLYQLLFAQLNIYSYVAITLVFPWIKIGTLSIVAWAQAASISISQAIGKQQHKKLTQIINSSIAVGLVASVFIAVGFYIISLLMETIYPNIADETYLALDTIAWLYILLPIARTYNTIAGTALRALGKSVAVLRVHFVTQWLVALPLCTLLIFYFEASLFWVFSIVLLEEFIKTVPFYNMLMQERLLREK